MLFGLVGLSAVAHAIRLIGARRGLEPAAVGQAHLTAVPVKTRGRIDLLRLDTVDWIESQGNYLALHVGDATHLVRDTLTRLEPQLDPARFVRVHRRAIVRIDRVDAMAPLSGGDAELRLTTGARVRVSRAHRERVRAALP